MNEDLMVSSSGHCVNLCEHWPAAEWEEIANSVFWFCMVTLKSSTKQDEEYSMYWCFHIGSMAVLSPESFLKECLNYSSLSYMWG